MIRQHSHHSNAFTIQHDFPLQEECYRLLHGWIKKARLFKSIGERKHYYTNHTLSSDLRNNESNNYNNNNKNGKRRKGKLWLEELELEPFVAVDYLEEAQQYYQKAIDILNFFLDNEEEDEDEDEENSRNESLSKDASASLSSSSTRNSSSSASSSPNETILSKEVISELKTALLFEAAECLLSKNKYRRGT